MMGLIAEVTEAERSDYTRSLDLTLGKRSLLRSGTERGVQIQISASTSQG